MFLDKPLSPAHIRLLRILPGEDDEDIVCNVVHQALFPTRTARIEDAEPFAFVALSYTWGLETPKREIVIEDEDRDEVFTIRENLWQFLWHLRDRECEDFLWADAICINQDNTEEKNAQVALMGVIFHAAQAVYIWLGEEADRSFILMNMLAFTLLRGKDLPFGIKQLPCASEQLVVWEAVLAFIRRPYWKRAWVVQEIALARGAIYAFCGPFVLEYRRLVASFDVLQWDRLDPRSRSSQTGREQRCAAKNHCSLGRVGHIQSATSRV